ncbi:MAG: hypothetical protein ACD_30C00036G0003 [uncultured bacterium]|uniref:Rod shape-determining protein MreD n=4 Tax=Microgenomates group TaxID=1794810 RepID=A0A1F5K488_9BACT|nr:MAG: hypothetical protein ACD_30C00036G0003 [uncultured bacterium]KKQ16138.1 MAG: hypothetical protein US28_C0005G0053 [Candidatus Daviesbacteria bacterium GW2011_GWA1_36_8]KKQ75782.1 MAG: hypothetical protein US96_C0004G0005 [Candidatus Woesebacteria bacterium GW2011_GWB1_38_5b]OGE16804.1 MAG: hypothetical protein A2858_02780 [Candidatus Daviesbacteria bacterium RIFCSPHIGHO2_01_FULL_36_37]OGE31410.1 MAG: hypothetical protein A3C99_02580 [Candidatus Daviesbacteria bacterium RIFCSPHIGHO2_02_F
MKTFLFILTLAALFQTTFLPVNLCLIIIITRSLAYEEPLNYYLALYAGIILGILSSTNLGIYGIIFLANVKLAHLLRKLPVTANVFTVVVISFVLFLLTAFLEMIFLKNSINIQKILIESAISLPMFIIIRIWEERFIVRPNVKLKIRE